MAAMTYPDVSHLQVAGGFLVLALVFVLREFASGALKKAGEEFWVWTRRQRSSDQAGNLTAEPLLGAGRGMEPKMPASPRNGRAGSTRSPARKSRGGQPANEAPP
jgi:hypothetical protein